MTRTTKTTTRKPTPNANKVNVNANKVKVNANKVGINAAKVRANAAKVAANAASVKANAAKAKVTPKVAATKPLANNKVKTATAVATPNYSTSGKSYIVGRGRIDQYGTTEQADSATRANNLWNDVNRSTERKSLGAMSGTMTKQGYLKDPSKFKAFTKKQIAELPEYKAPGNTGAGPLLRKSSVKNATGFGGCEAGFRLDSQGNCVRIRGYVRN